MNFNNVKDRYTCIIHRHVAWGGGAEGPLFCAATYMIPCKKVFKKRCYVSDTWIFLLSYFITDHFFSFHESSKIVICSISFSCTLLHLKKKYSNDKNTLLYIYWLCVCLEMDAISYIELLQTRGNWNRGFQREHKRH